MSLSVIAKKGLLFSSVLVAFLGSPAAATAQKTDTASVYFKYKEKALSRSAKNFIDTLLFSEVLVHGQKLTILGFADSIGGAEYNLSLSEKRAHNVKKYLLSLGLADADMKLVIGKGRIEHAAPVKGLSSDRKVLIIIDGSPGARKEMVAPAAARLESKIAAVKVNQAVALKNLQFEGDRHHLLAVSRPTLDTLLAIMNDNPTLKIQVEGHICCLDPSLGSDKEDAEGGGMLSVTRAKMVYDFLVRKGIAKERIKYIGLGSTKPLVPITAMPDEQAKNRRVEIRVLSK
ncbi:MAG: OmpA family protein [Taibaiella sp.]|nr:OmpA family protein [Taibaiella sp.]